MAPRARQSAWTAGRRSSVVLTTSATPDAPARPDPASGAVMASKSATRRSDWAPMAAWRSSTWAASLCSSVLTVPAPTMLAAPS